MNDAAIAFYTARLAFQTDVTRRGRIVNNGCDGVWGSPAVDRRHGLVFFDTADCDSTDSMPFAERVIALHSRNGRLAWVFKPPRKDPGCDWDFGATPNFRSRTASSPAFLGVGGKDGTYYSVSPTTGKLGAQIDDPREIQGGARPRGAPEPDVVAYRDGFRLAPRP